MIVHLINGQTATQVSVLDRGLLYGDGLFETIWVQNGILFYWEEHYQRLKEGCVKLGLSIPDELILQKEARQLCHSDGVIKIIITRGEGDRGYQLPKKNNDTRIISFFPELNNTTTQHRWKKITARICSTRAIENTSINGIKHLNRLTNVLARAEWQNEEIQEGILLNTQNHIVSGTMTNIFILKKDILYTPQIESGCISGIARKQIIRYCENHAIPCFETTITLEEMLNATEIFFCNCIQGLWSVGEIEGQSKQYSTQFTERNLKQALVFC